MFATLYYVVNRRGRFVCGPFWNIHYAQHTARNYSNSSAWGECHIEARPHEL